MIERVYEYIKEERLIRAGDRILLGVSGGPDSVALLRVFLALRDRLDLGLAVCHVNHNLRQEAHDEAEFVRKLCEREGLPCRVYQVDVREEVSKSSQGTQEVARRLRFRSFLEMYKSYDADRLALAHHADDQAETVLLNILRGTGPEGLAGIKPRQSLEIGRESMEIIHPLLFLPRNEVLTFCRQKGLEYKIDNSNLKTDYLRNRVRLELLPELEAEYNPRLREKLFQLAEIVRGEEEFWQDLIQDNWDIYLQESCRSQRVIWKLAPLRQEKLAVLRRIFRKGLEIVKGDLNNISFGHIADMIKLVREGQVHGEVHLPAGLRCKLGYCDFILERAKEEESLDDYSITLQIPGEAWIPGCERKITAVRLDRGEGTLPRGQSKAWVDARHAGPSLLVRNRRPGDRFRPLGMNGEKKLKDFFIDEKVPLKLRDRIPLVCDQQGRIIWVVGYRLDDRYKITEETEEVVALEMD